jgi:branched-chain amino acid transport system ATP-binding protein
MLRVEKVDSYYGRIKALSGVSISVGKGEIVAIIGANGAGKTTLLNTVSGVVNPRAGHVLFEGLDITGKNAVNIVRLGVSHVPQGRQVFGTLSVLDNLILGAYVHSTKNWRDSLGYTKSFMKRESIKKTMDSVFELFPILLERQKQQAGSLSGGEQQMLAIGRALMSSPRLLLLDEPSLGLAPLVVRDILKLCLRLREEGLTILLVEQNATAALKIADRGYVLETGHIHTSGMASDLLEDEQVQRAYLGRRDIPRAQRRVRAATNEGDGAPSPVERV